MNFLSSCRRKSLFLSQDDHYNMINDPILTILLWFFSFSPQCRRNSTKSIKFFQQQQTKFERIALKLNKKHYFSIFHPFLRENQEHLENFKENWLKIYKESKNLKSKKPVVGAFSSLSVFFFSIFSNRIF